MNRLKTITDLKNLSFSCRLGKLKDGLVKDLIIVALNKNNNHIRERLLVEEDKTKLEKIIELVKKLESSIKQAEQLQISDDNVGINNIHPNFGSRNR